MLEITYDVDFGQQAFISTHEARDDVEHERCGTTPASDDEVREETRKLIGFFAWHFDLSSHFLVIEILYINTTSMVCNVATLLKGRSGFLFYCCAFAAGLLFSILFRLPLLPPFL